MCTGLFSPRPRTSLGTRLDSYKWPKATRKTTKRKKCAVMKVPLFVFFLSFLLRPLCSTMISCKRFKSTHRHFSTKLMLITARSSTTTQCLHSFKFTLVNKSHSQHSEAAVRCLGRHFKFCTHAHTKSRSQTKDHGRWSGSETSTQAKWPAGSTHGWHGLFPPRHSARLMNTT